MKQNPSIILSALLGATLLALTACNSPVQHEQRPIYPDLLQPTVVTLKFPKGTSTPEVNMQIDHLKGLIYNDAYLPYGSKIDSAYLQMQLSNQCKAVITNETTGISREWMLTDTSKIDISGGKLRLLVSRPGSERPDLTYKIRIQIYGYDPYKLTWKRLQTPAPTPTTDGQYFTTQGQTYWMARNGKSVKLYRIEDMETSRYTLVQENLPLLRPKSINIDHNGDAWALSDDDKVYRAAPPLKEWIPVSTGDIRITTLLYDKEQSSGQPAHWKVIGYPATNPRSFASYTFTNGNTHKGADLDKRFPVRHSYVYSYDVAGSRNANIIGGVTHANEAIKEVFFSSDGLHWAMIPYRGKGFETPLEGGLFLRSGDNVYLVGGKYTDGIRNAMYVSNNRGVDWVELTKEKEPGREFTPRYGASGMIRPDKSDEMIYIVGGIVEGKPSTEVWKGFRDRSGGILNSIEQ